MIHCLRRGAANTTAILAVAVPLLGLTACGGSFSHNDGVSSTTAASPPSVAGSSSPGAPTTSFAPSPASPQPVNGSTSAPIAGSTNGVGGGGSSVIWTIEYTVAGLATGDSVDVVLNGTYSRTISKNLAMPAGVYLFVPDYPANYPGLPVGSAYAITIGAAPSGETCTVANGAGSLQLNGPPQLASITCTAVANATAAEMTPAQSGRVSAAVSATPPPRHGATVVSGAMGTGWLFGGTGVEGAGKSTQFNDLWRFSSDTGLWERMGSLSSPPARADAESWMDASGSLWVFGGQYQTPDGAMARLNDLWQFSPSTGEWLLKSGSISPNAVGTYGIQAVSPPSNSHNARFGAAGWSDSTGNLWLMGGDGIDAGGAAVILNDLWKYAPATDGWTYISGFSTPTPTRL